MVDLGEDLDVEGAVALEPVVGLAEEPGEVAEVLGAELDRARPALASIGGEVAPAVAGEDHPVDPRRDVEVPGDPVGVIRAATEIGRTATSAANPAAGRRSSSTCRRRELGQAAGHEQDAGVGCRSSRPAVDRFSGPRRR